MSWNLNDRLENLEREIKVAREESVDVNNELRHQLAFIQREQINIQMQVWLGLVLLLIILVILTWRFWLSVLVWFGVSVPAFFIAVSSATGLRQETVLIGLGAIFGLVFMCVEWWKDSPAKAYLSRSEKSTGQEPSKVVDTLRKSLNPHRELDPQGYSHRMEQYRQDAQRFLNKTKSK
jgi:hypothetical protein